MLASIDESYAYENSDEESISTDYIEDIRDGSYVHPNINVRYALLKMRDCIRKYQDEWKIS